MHHPLALFYRRGSVGPERGRHTSKVAQPRGRMTEGLWGQANLARNPQPLGLLCEKGEINNICLAGLLEEIEYFFCKPSCLASMVAHQAPLSMGFPRQEYWRGCHFLLQGIFPTQRSNPCLLHWQVDSLPLRHQGSPCS